MAVAAPSVNDASSAANVAPVGAVGADGVVAVVDPRTAPVRAGVLEWDGPDVVTGWHRHPYHQIEYALRGVAEVETPTGRYLLPSQQAIWIPAGLAHRTTLRDVRSVAVFFEPAMVPGAGGRARILAAAPVVREMISYAVRWPISRAPGSAGEEADADVFFGALSRVVVGWLDAEVPLRLPVTDEPLMAAVIAHTDAHLADVSVASVCRAVGLSERTLRRRFEPAVGMTWREYVRQSRLLRATALLTETSHPVAQIAAMVGFDSPSGFARAFRTAIGEPPHAYRRRVRTAASAEVEASAR